MAPSIMAALIVVLTVTLLITQKRTRLLVKEKEMFILKFDSLHILTIETRNQLHKAQQRADSLAGSVLHHK